MSRARSWAFIREISSSLTSSRRPSLTYPTSFQCHHSNLCQAYTGLLNVEAGKDISLHQVSALLYDAEKGKVLRGYMEGV